MTRSPWPRPSLPVQDSGEDGVVLAFAPKTSNAVMGRITNQQQILVRLGAGAKKNTAPKSKHMVLKVLCLQSLFCWLNLVHLD